MRQGMNRTNVGESVGPTKHLMVAKEGDIRGRDQVQFKTKRLVQDRELEHAQMQLQVFLTVEKAAGIWKGKRGNPNIQFHQFDQNTESISERRSHFLLKHRIHVLDHRIHVF